MVLVAIWLPSEDAVVDDGCHHFAMQDSEELSAVLSEARANHHIAALIQ